MRTVSRTLLACVLLVSGALGCGTIGLHPYTLADDHVSGTGTERLLLVPLNMTVDLHPELDRPSGRVFELVVAYLRERSKHVTILPLYEAREIWQQAEREVAGDPSLANDFEAVAGRYVALLQRAVRFDALVMPNLVYRDGKLTPKVVIWDGVRRPLSSTRMPGIVEALLRSNPKVVVMPSASLQVFVFDAEGEPVFESLGGLDVTHEMVFENRREKGEYQFRLLEDRLQNRKALREGIALTFDPYILSPISAATAP